MTKYRYYDQKLSCLFLSKIVWTWRLTAPSSQERHLTSHICIKLARCCHVTAPPSHGGKSAAPAPGLWEERGGHVMPHLDTQPWPSTHHCTLFSSSLWARQWQTPVRISARNISTSKYFVMKGNYFYNRFRTQVYECWDSVEVENMWECLRVRIIALQYKI